LGRCLSPAFRIFCGKNIDSKYFSLWGGGGYHSEAVATVRENPRDPWGLRNCAVPHVCIVAVPPLRGSVVFPLHRGLTPAANINVAASRLVRSQMQWFVPLLSANCSCDTQTPTGLNEFSPLYPALRLPTPIRAKSPPADATAASAGDPDKTGANRGPRFRLHAGLDCFAPTALCSLRLVPPMQARTTFRKSLSRAGGGFDPVGGFVSSTWRALPVMVKRGTATE